MSQTQNFYNDFKEAVKLRTVDNMAVPVSGGLDSTLIVKALHDNGDLGKCHFIYFRDSQEYYMHKVMDTYVSCCQGINIFGKYLLNTDSCALTNIVEIWEEPYYALSINYQLFQAINEMNIRVCMSGCGADELFGGYTYYNTPDYPRGFMQPIEARSNEEKKKEDLHLLMYHHLRKMDKMGMYFEVESRYPFLDSKVRQYEDVGKSMIKEILSQDFDDNFINRPKQGFRAGESSKDMYLKQVNIWTKLFVCD
jgi:asparagine synthase (glutamine-hydrolysing)